MKPAAIVYVSNTGYTEAYAALLSQKSGLPAYRLEDALNTFTPNVPVIYMGWLMAGMVKNYKKAARRLRVSAVCGVGLGDTGAQDAAVRKSNKIPTDIPVFTLQGGMDHSELHGIYKSMIEVLTKALNAKKARSTDEDKMLTLLQKGGNYVSLENLSAVMEWYQHA